VERTDPGTATTAFTTAISNKSLLTIFFIWAVWVVVLLGYQTLVEARLQPSLPDFVLEWTPDWTDVDSHDGNPYLTEPFMNRQVSMDSEYYLSIATGGYDDPDGRAMRTRSGREISLNYAFFPFYPALMSAVSAPLKILGMNPVATATLAGTIISLLGTLAGMIALYDLTRHELEESGGIRTAFYLLIFPSSFFLAQVYTEGLFVGLAFSSLALMRRKQLLLAGILAALATWTRSIGAALLIPLGLAWLDHILKARREAQSNVNFLKTYVLPTLALLLPLAAYFIWRHAMGANFDRVENDWFGRTLFDWERLSDGISFALEAIREPDNLQRRIYFLIEFGAAALGLAAAVLLLRRYPGIALFTLFALVIGFTSGAPQSWVRYVVSAPAVFIFLSRLGRSTVFDRTWTLASVLLMGFLTLLYTYDMWVA
jgi:hypothetical protein